MIICKHVFTVCVENCPFVNISCFENVCLQIDRFTTLSSLYGQAGFHRKEAFFKRVAAMQCVSPATKPAWHQCYQLLLQAVSGFNINLDPRESKTGQDLSLEESLYFNLFSPPFLSAIRIAKGLSVIEKTVLKIAFNIY